MKHSLAFLFALSCAHAAVTNTATCSAPAPFNQTITDSGPDKAECAFHLVSGMQESWPTAWMIGNSMGAMGEGFLYQPGIEEDGKAEATWHAQDALTLGGTGSATLRVWSVPSGGPDYAGIAGVRINSEQQWMQPDGYSALEVGLNFRITLGEQFQFERSAIASYVGQPQASPNGRFISVRLLRLEVFDSNGTPILPTHTSAEGWEYPFALADTQGPVLTPEPATFGLAGIALLCLLGIRKSNSED